MKETMVILVSHKGLVLIFFLETNSSKNCILIVLKAGNLVLMWFSIALWMVIIITLWKRAYSILMT